MTILDFPVAEPEAPAPPSIPHSREAEEGVVGAVLINPECYYEVAEVVAPADFYIHRHRWIMEAVKGLMERKVPVDMLTVSEELDRMGQLAEIGGPAYLTRLIGGVPSSLNAASYARIVKEHEVARRMITAANDIAQLAYDVAKPMDMRMALAEKQWQAIRKDADAKSSRLLGMKDLLSNAWDRMEAIAKLGRPPGIISNFLDLDKILHGFKKGRYYLIAGRPGSGKTIFQFYEECIGPLTQFIADELKDSEKTYPRLWIEDALKECVLQNKRNWKYAAAILKRWKEQGRDNGNGHRPRTPLPPPTVEDRPMVTPEMIAKARGEVK